MGKVFWNLPEIPIPDDASRNSYDNQVSKYYRDGKNNRRRVVIGHAVTTTTMHPNENFRFYYPGLWKKYYSEDVIAQHELHFGQYAMLLGAGYRCGIYSLLHEHFGPEHANAIMDYAMYSIGLRSSSTQLLQDALYEQMRFSRRDWDDSWYSTFFSSKLPADSIHAFKIGFLQRYAALKPTKVWICIDGSNRDCQMQGSSLAAQGQSKSGNNFNIISYIWAVDAETGMPVTWFVNPGSTPDVKALKEIVTFLAHSGIQVEGVILDRGFVAQETVSLVEDKLGLKLVMMLKSTTNAYCEMMERHASTIRRDLRYVLENSRDGMFGTVDQVKLFKSSSKQHYVGLFFNGSNGSKRIIHFINKVLDEVARLRQVLAVSPDIAEVEPKFRKYVLINRDGPKPEVEFIYDTWQQEMDSKCYSAIASSETISADELNKRYTLRQASECQFSLLKSQLNGGVIRVHSDESAKARFLVSFVASVLRTELMLTCKKHHLDLNEVMQKANTARMVLMPDHLYHSVNGCSKKVKTVLGEYGITEEHFDVFVNEVNTLNASGLGSQFKKMPGQTDPQENCVKTEPDSQKPKRRPGRPKGSKNKKTLEREALAAQQLAATKRGPGRPKGSKNKKTLEREALAAQQQSATSQSPEPPEASENKKAPEREALAVQQPSATSQGPEPPEASENKKAPER